MGHTSKKKAKPKRPVQPELANRPYLRVKYDLAQAYTSREQYAEAVRELEDLLELDPGDHLKGRHSLLSLYLLTGNLEGADRLFAQFKRETSAVFAWGKVLRRLIEGDYRRAATAFRAAQRANRPVLDYLAGRKDLPDEAPEHSRPGEDSEAVHCILSQWRAWMAYPEARFWVATHGRIRV
jgi:tetratricopeptide (TPR) repeat protein